MVDSTNEAAAVELLPCPFCKDGGTPSVYAPNPHVWCLTCDCAGPHLDTPEEAIAAWNTRAAIAAHAAAGGDTDAERVLDQVMQERDRYHDMADQLADQIAAITEQDIGEHSSANCPWHSALLAADEFIAARFRRQVFGPREATNHAAALAGEADRLLDQVMRERDRYHETADDLADCIARLTDTDIGEHSSANCPWQNAILAAEYTHPTSAPDVAALRDTRRTLTDEALIAGWEAKAIEHEKSDDYEDQVKAWQLRDCAAELRSRLSFAAQQETAHAKA